MGAQNQSLSTLFQMMLVFAEVVEWQNFSSWRAAGRRLRWTSVFVSAEYNCVNSPEDTFARFAQRLHR